MKHQIETLDGTVYERDDVTGECVELAQQIVVPRDHVRKRRELAMGYGMTASRAARVFPDDVQRGTGITTRQLEDAAEGAMFFVPHGAMKGHVQDLAASLGRHDLDIRARCDLNMRTFAGREISGIVLDHALGRLTEEELAALHYAEFAVQRYEHKRCLSFADCGTISGRWSSKDLSARSGPAPAVMGRLTHTGAAPTTVVLPSAVVGQAFTVVHLDEEEPSEIGFGPLQAVEDPQKTLDSSQATKRTLDPLPDRALAKWPDRGFRTLADHPGWSGLPTW